MRSLEFSGLSRWWTEPSRMYTFLHGTYRNFDADTSTPSPGSWRHANGQVWPRNASCQDMRRRPTFGDNPALLTSLGALPRTAEHIIPLPTSPMRLEVHAPRSHPAERFSAWRGGAECGKCHTCGVLSPADTITKRILPDGKELH